MVVGEENCKEPMHTADLIRTYKYLRHYRLLKRVQLRSCLKQTLLLTNRLFLGWYEFVCAIDDRIQAITICNAQQKKMDPTLQNNIFPVIN